MNPIQMPTVQNQATLRQLALGTRFSDTSRYGPK